VHIFGRNPVLEALSSNTNIEKVFVQYGAEGAAIAAIKQAAKKREIPCSTMDKAKFSQLEREVCGAEYGSGRAQGVIVLTAALTILSPTDLIERSFVRAAPSEAPLVVALDGINDPHNLGAIARSAECAGAVGLLVPESKSAPLGGAAMKTSAGALEHLLVARTSSLTKSLQDFKNAGFSIIGLDMSGTAAHTDDLYGEALVVVIGSEGEGMNPAVKRLCDTVVSIQLHGNISSLNASVATGVVLFEAARQRALAAV
jgi:23S rRNA (guanosine2251-2'-O)-methyltransferase